MRSQGVSPASLSVDTPCWTWHKPNKEGYGLLPKPFLGTRYLHRISYTLFYGPIPDGLHIDHLCRNRACLNPGHLEPVTARENWRRGVSPSAENARRTHCLHGHPFVTVTRADGSSVRRCLECKPTRKPRSPRSGLPRVVGGLAPLPAAITPEENARRMAMKTHCPNGHAYTDDNTRYVRSRNSLARRCMTCHRIASRRRSAS